MENVALNLQLENSAFDTDIDEIFTELLAVEPPANMIERVMSAVNELPRHSQIASPWGTFNQFFAQSDATQLC